MAYAVALACGEATSLREKSTQLPRHRETIGTSPLAMSRKPSRSPANREACRFDDTFDLVSQNPSTVPFSIAGIPCVWFASAVNGFWLRLTGQPEVGAMRIANGVAAFVLLLAIGNAKGIPLRMIHDPIRNP